ncbi:LysR family transcriptional regulator [Actinocrispum sp. NPDC049592]|uniref:LysR family transcriptional regulator n=1 Tax=Actinocrispum sp. NPDC049592 TaxID=3154835 RepID=UPI00342131A7
MRLDLLHLELIVAIGNAGSLRRAAAELHLTQPAVTTQLRRIERHLGGALFLRGAEGVQPTHLGALVPQQAKQVLGQLTELEQTARREAASVPVRVAGIPAQQYALLVETEVGLAELAAESWVMPHPDDSGMNEFFAAACRAAGFEQRITDFTTESHVAFALTASGRVICPLYPIGANRDGLVTLPLAGNPLFRRIVLAWRAGWAEAAMVDELCARIGKGYRELVAGAPVHAGWWARGGAGFALPGSE